MRKSLTAYKSGSEKELGLGGTSVRPVFLRLQNKEEKVYYKDLIQNVPGLEIFDTIDRQLRELVRIKNVPENKDAARVEALMLTHLNGQSMEEYGVWVYYPWSNRLVHLLDEAEFIQLRTSRNRLKITSEEQQVLQSKKIGIIGLSVGQSVAMTLALERVCGSLHLADFDELDLSNMNRLNVGVHEIGVNKAVLAAQKIAELDPFLEVTCFTAGVTDQNLDEFFTQNGNLDILVEECDSVDVKIKSRIKARQMGIPVVMDTNDKGMLDVERFDLEQDRPLFHGRMDTLNGLEDAAIIKKINTLQPQERMVLTIEIIGLENVSDRMKQSLGEINKTITSWPQLASAVHLGGAMVTDVCRRILLNQYSASGRYFVDIADLINE